MVELKIIWVRFGERVGVLGGSVVLLREFSKRVKGKAQLFFVSHEISYKWHRVFGVKVKPLFLDRTKWSWRPGTISSLYSIFRTFLHPFKGRYHIVAARSHYLQDILPAIWIKMKTKAELVVYTITLVVPEFGGWSLLNWFIIAVQHFLSILLIKKFADLVFVLNLHDKSTYERFGIDPKKIRLTHGGINFEVINRLPEPVTKEYDALYVGRFSKSKGIYDLLETWKYVTDIKSECKADFNWLWIR